MSPSGFVLAGIVLTLFTALAVSEPIPSPPTITRQPAHEQLFTIAQEEDDLPEPFALECEAEGYPNPKFRWTKDGSKFELTNRIDQRPNSGTMVFSEADESDEGIYQCFVENVHGVALSNSVSLRISKFDSFPEEDMIPQVINATVGDPLTIACTPPAAYPPPTIFWTLLSSQGAIRTLNDTRITTDPEGSLHFSSVNLDDALDDVMYTCAATSYFRNEYKLGIRRSLNVNPREVAESRHPPVKQYTSPANVSILVGQLLSLTCIYGGDELLDITWQKVGSSLDERRVSYAYYGKILRINDVNFNDSGVYECVASNGAGEAQSHAMQVHVEAAPVWIIEPSNAIEPEGGSVTFNCVARGVPEPELHWLENGVLINATSKDERRKINGSKLVIDDLVESDTAVYQCNASNVHGYAFRNVYLNVLNLPAVIITAPEPYTRALVNSNVILRCNAFGVPKPDINWLKNGEELNDSRYKILDNGNLEIQKVSFQDQGDFTCNASNRFNHFQASTELRVKEKTKIVSQPEDLEVTAYTSASFKCRAVTDPSLTLEVQWLFNGIEIDFDYNPKVVKMNDGSLIISKTTELDSGEYTCVAKTELDEDLASATLVVLDIPGPPNIVRVECDGLIASLTWEPAGDGRTPILGFTIQINNYFTPDMWKEITRIPVTDPNSFVIPLTPGTKFSFRVVAFNRIGLSWPSDPSEQCTSPEDVPHRNPEMVTGKGNASDNLVIYWQPQLPIYHNAPGFCYKVSWRRNDSDSSAFESVIISDWKQNEYLLEHQETYVPYIIKVEALNDRGQANVAATEIIGYSGEGVPELAPENFTLLEVTSPRSAVFTFDPVPQESVKGRLKGYKIQTWNSNETVQQKREYVISPFNTRHVVNVFKPFSTNLVRVLAFNGLHDGPPSDTIDVSTPEGTPSAVGSFDVQPIDLTTLFLTWEKPYETNGILTGYRIYYQEVQDFTLGPLMERTPSLNYNETSAKLEYLKPETKYRIFVTATTSAGQGDRYFIEERTKANSIATTIITEPEPDENMDVKVFLNVVGEQFCIQIKSKDAEEWLNVSDLEGSSSLLRLDAIYEIKVIAKEHME